MIVLAWGDWVCVYSERDLGVFGLLVVFYCSVCCVFLFLLFFY